MKTAALIKKEHIYLQETLSSQAEAFDRLAQIAYESGAAKTKQAVIDGLAQREAESTTGFIDGFAIPHAKLKDITEATVIIIQNKAGIEWNALDQTPVTFIIALLIPMPRQAAHISIYYHRCLACLFTKMRGSSCLKPRVLTTF
ncbi:PTS sugar transporter subunit IIA [Bacillus licheniformis]|uniref:PTS sugar transporter subunit IIA n=1 Tax=Bacillus licheniformis TaxID=1402 RepID=UPI00018C8DA2|nr:PTS sugar transporter subunit IIA [Bacillus licheniformis]